MLRERDPGSADQALDSVINVHIEWMQQFYAALMKPPDPGRSSSAMEMESISIHNTAKKRSRMITAPDINAGAMGSWDLASGTAGSWKPELDMCRNAEATPVTTTPVPRSSCSFIIKDVKAAVNTPALHKHSSAISSGPASTPAAAEAAGGLCRGRSGAVKLKKKRVRPSRRVPATVVKTDTSNFMAMVQQFTGILPAMTTTEESTGAPSPSSSSPEFTSSASSPSFSKPIPQPAVCEISSSPTSSNTTSSTATATCPSPLLPSSLPTCQSLPELPFITGYGHTPTSDDPEELTLSFVDAAFFDELWS